jgi:ABC-type antimicrobial peptide transport system permease subunit
VRFLGFIGKYKFSTGARVISRNVALSKKSEAIGAMFIAMMFTTGFFASIAATTGQNHVVELIMFDVGADVVVEVDPALTNVTLDLVSNITQIEGVQSASGVLKSTAYTQYITRTWSGWLDSVNTSVSIYAVQPEAWAESAFFLDYFTYTHIPADALSMLESDPFNVLASFKPIQQYQENAIGQRVPIYSNEIQIELLGPEGKNRSDYIIQDVMAQYVPGQGFSQVTYLPGDSSNIEFIVMNIELFHQVLNRTSVNKFYINLEEGVNYTRVMHDVFALAPNSFSNIRSGLELLDEALESRAGQTVYGFYTLNVVFQIIYLTAGMVIVASIRVRKLRRQISILRALGSENTPIVAPILIDTILSIIIGVLIGSLTGVILASIFSQVPLSFFGSVNVFSWLRLPVMLVFPVELILGIIGLSLLTSVSTSYWITTRNMKRNIAEEIQYTE